MKQLNEIKMPLDHTPEDLKKKIEKLARVKADSYRIIKKSVDARNKDDVHFVYGVIVNPTEQRETPELNVKQNYQGRKPIVVGCGPAGLFAALVLAEAGLEPVVVERGKAAEQRAVDVERFWNGGGLDTESNVQFGEGGAGTFSDGKLTTGIKDERIVKVLSELVEAGADEEILYLAKPHIGTDKLRIVVGNIRKKITALGGEFRFGSKMTDICIESGALQGIEIEASGERYIMETDRVILAIGHSARDTVEMLYSRGIKMLSKPFSAGVRIEHLQKDINRTQYGRFAESPALGAAEYKLSAKLRDSTGVYTFCMCPGGMVVAAASEKGMLVTNGMSYSDRAAVNANSAVLVSVPAFPNALDGIAFQRKLEAAAFLTGGGDYKAPVQLAGDFLNGNRSSSPGNVEPSYKPGYVMADLRDCLEPFLADSIAEALRSFDRKLHGFASYDSVLTAVESRSSSPVRIVRDEGYNSSVRGLIPCGEGGGFSGGIISSAVDGIRCAEACAVL